MNADGTNQMRLTFDPAEDVFADWSPDSTQLTFRSTRDAGNQDVYKMDASGANQVRLTTHPAPDETPRWSPDGAKIIFVSVRDGNTEVYTMDPDGSNKINLTNIAAGDFGPDWQSVPPPVITLTLDIKPGSDPNSVNVRSKGVIPVAILSDASFDASSVAVISLAFGPAGAQAAHGGHIDDVNDDGFPDLVVHFRTQDTGIACGDTVATLTGETLGGQDVEGQDSVTTVGCN